MDRIMILWKRKEEWQLNHKWKGRRTGSLYGTKDTGYVWMVKGQRVRAVKGGDDGEVDKW